jgi:hypothetical protein
MGCQRRCPELIGKRSVGACEAGRETIVLELAGRNSMGILPGSDRWARVCGRLPERQAFRAHAARRGVAGSASDHRDTAGGREF